MSANLTESAPQEAAMVGANFNVQKIYLKDVSFEAPNAPLVFNEQGQPELNMGLNQKVAKLAEGIFEVVLGVTLTCKIEDKTIYLVEVAQAGIFGLTGFDEQGLDAMLGIHCPNVLYPYARQAVSDLIGSGGFPPFYLQPMNFEAVYAEGLRRRADQMNGASESSTVVAESGNA
ncbi:MAG: protein-export chaperone SecB [Arenimonas sp.]|nr:protein-export chaperone SecB [Arenimonas sp.]